MTQLTEGFNANHPKNKNKSGFAQIAREGKVIDLDAMNDMTTVTSEVVSITRHTQKVQEPL